MEKTGISRGGKEKEKPAIEARGDKKRNKRKYRTDRLIRGGAGRGKAAAYTGGARSVLG